MNALMDFIALVLKLAIPITLAAMAGTLSERSGVINIGLEGTMLIGAFVAAAGSFYSGNPVIGVILAVIAGFLVGFLHSLFCVSFRGHQVVVGVAINLFASGITPVLCRILWNNEGASDLVPSLENIDIPILKDIPVVGRVFVDQTPFIYVTLVVFIFLMILMYKTKFGLRLRMIGDNPLGVQAQGVDVRKYKYFAVIISGGIGALGGAYLSVAFSNVFVQGMVAGRGFIGMASNIFGGWRIGGSLLASVFFAAVQSTRYYLIGSGIPEQFIQMIPYVATLLVLVLLSRNSKAPEGLGKSI